MDTLRTTVGTNFTRLFLIPHNDFSLMPDDIKGIVSQKFAMLLLVPLES
jgi:hypothetical protein